MLKLIFGMNSYLIQTKICRDYYSLEKNENIWILWVRKRGLYFTVPQGIQGFKSREK